MARMPRPPTLRVPRTRRPLRGWFVCPSWQRWRSRQEAAEYLRGEYTDPVSPEERRLR